MWVTDLVSAIFFWNPRSYLQTPAPTSVATCIECVARRLSTREQDLARDLDQIANSTIFVKIICGWQDLCSTVCDAVKVRVCMVTGALIKTLPQNDKTSISELACVCVCVRNCMCGVGLSFEVYSKTELWACTQVGFSTSIIKLAAVANA